MSKAKQSVPEKYSAVIDALVPFAARGKLSEGLNKLRARIDQADLEEIRYEVNRLISPCEESVDTSGFAKGKCYTIKVNEAELTVDAVGERIFNQEMDKHNRNYTEGVREAVSSEKRYKEQLRFEHQQKLVENFSVTCLTGNNDIDIEKVKVVPEFTITCIKINNNEPIPFAYLSINEIALTVKGKPAVSKGEAVTFTFPPMPKVTDSEYTAGYKCKSIQSGKKRGQFTMVFVAEDDDKWLERLETFIRQNAQDLPLEAEQEVERTRDRILKDTIVSNSPISATLCEQKNGTLVPHSTLMPQGVDAEPKDSSNVEGLSYSKPVFTRLTKEFQTSRETYQFHCTMTENDQELKLVANLGELIRDNLLSSFIACGLDNNSLRVYRLSLVSKQDAMMRTQLFNVSLKDVSLAKLKFIVYCVDVSKELNHFALSHMPSTDGLIAKYQEGTEFHNVNFSLPNHLNRRVEARYEFPFEATIKTGLVKSRTCTLIDISSKGMQLKLKRPWRSKARKVRISIPSLELSNIKYRIIRVGDSGDTLHLKMTSKSADKYAFKINRILAHNINYFTPRSKQLQQENAFDYLWDLVTCSLPGVHILIGKGNGPKEQLIVAHTDGAANSLAPFSLKRNKLPTHGWFADAEEDSLGSLKLQAIVYKKENPDRALFYVNRDKARYSTISKEKFANEDTRQKLHNSIVQKKGKLIAHTMQVADCSSLDENWYHKRCQHLAQIDKPAIGQIRKQEVACQNVLSIIPVSLLHKHLLLVGEFAY